MKRIDAFLFMELSDLAKTLTENKQFEVELAFQSYYDPVNDKATVSFFWEHRSDQVTTYGLKSDLYLRCIGNHDDSDLTQFKYFLREANDSNFPSFAKQLFVLAEDIRLEERCKQLRPGTHKAFEIRRETYRDFFVSQLNANLLKSQYVDALFSYIYVLLTTRTPSESSPAFTPKIDHLIPMLKEKLQAIFEASSTVMISKICTDILHLLAETLPGDMINTYFHLPDLYMQNFPQTQTMADLKRTDGLKNEDQLDQPTDENEDSHEQTLPVWHRETKDKTKSFLQFDVEQGSNSSLLGEGVREGDASDQAMALVQGSSQKSQENDYTHLEALEATKKISETHGQYGKDNQFAKAVFCKPDQPSQADELQYQTMKTQVLSLQKQLKQTIQKTIEHKKNEPRHHLHAGRLSKHLVPLFTDENPRIFYKKQAQSNRLDVAFSLLVDCSASMQTKMAETKLGIILFHEALKSLLVPHAITGFYEAAEETKEHFQPNYFHNVIEFDKSLTRQTGPEIIQLQAEDDNRDGFAIRIVSEQLQKRTEKRKFLIVFSDGEPAAYGYEQNGILDTHQAVVAARKNGMIVMNVFLANGEIEEAQQKVIENIYGKYTITVPNVSELPRVLLPLLKKLLLKSL